MLGSRKSLKSSWYEKSLKKSLLCLYLTLLTLSWVNLINNGQLKVGFNRTQYHRWMPSNGSPDHGLHIFAKFNKLAKVRKMRKPPGKLSLKKFGPGKPRVKKVWAKNILWIFSLNWTILRRRNKFCTFIKELLLCNWLSWGFWLFESTEWKFESITY